MPIQILMPALSPTMTEGNLVKWLKSEGQQVKAGEVIAEIETDKATMEVEAVDEGTLARIVVPAGTENVAVNALIAVLLEEGEDASAVDKISSASTVPKPPTSAPTPTPTEVPATAPAPVEAKSEKSKEGKRVFASPLARRLAEQSQLDVASLTGSGPHGRVIKLDVEAAMKKGSAVGKMPPVTGQIYGESLYVDIPLNNMRKIIAKRLTESKQEVPHFYLTVDCTMDKLMALRAEINSLGSDEEKVSVNDFIIRSVALALIKVPEANVSWQEKTLRQYQSADVAVAVAIEGGLVTPIIRSAEQKTLRQLSAEMKTLAGKARAGKLAPEEFQGGTFTISNLGMYGIKNFGAIINPPQACILAIGMGEQRPVIQNGQIQIATQMTCTLSVDHRAVDGAVGSRILAAFKELIEDPLRLLI